MVPKVQFTTLVLSFSWAASEHTAQLYISPMPFLPPPHSPWVVLLSSLTFVSLQLGSTRGNNSPALIPPPQTESLIHPSPSIHPYSVPLISLQMLASGIHLPMFSMFDAFKCMGYNSYVRFIFLFFFFLKKKVFASYYLNKQEAWVSSLFVLLESSWSQCFQTPSTPLRAETTVLEEVNWKRPPGMHCGP